MRLAAILLAFISTALAQTYSISKFAGGGLPANIPAMSAELGEISAIAVDGLGNLYVAPYRYNVVERVGQDGIITIVAGNGTGGFGGDGGPATQAQLGTVQGLAVAPNGDLYISDALNLRIRRVSNGIITTVVGGGNQGYFSAPVQATSAQLSGPGLITFDSNGNLFVADNLTLAKVSGGMISRVPLPGPTGTLEITGMSADSKGNVYVLYFTHQTASVPPANYGPIVWRSDGVTQQLQATTIAVNANGALYYVNANSIWVSGSSVPVVGTGAEGFTGDGGPASMAELNGTTQIAFDAANNLYILDFYNQRVRKVSNGIITTIAGTTSNGQIGDGGPAIGAQLSAAAAAVAPDGSVYIADPDHNRIRRVANGTISTVAGDGTAAFSGDGGSASAAELNAPRGVAVDRAGNVYIADTGNSRVRQISNGKISTIAVTPSTPNAVAVDVYGRVYVTSPGLEIIFNGALYPVAQSTGFVSIDDLGDIYTSAPDGVVLKTLQGSTSIFTSTYPSYPSFAASPGGDLYLGYANQVVVDKNGIETQIAGGGTQTQDGIPALSASLTNPAVLAADANGNVYITDNGILKLLSTGPQETNAALITPAPGSALTSSTVTFSWTSAPNALYHLYVGTSFRGTEILTQYQGTNLSATITNLPTNSSTIYVTLWTWFADRGWAPVDYAYNAASNSVSSDVPAAMNAPAPASALTASTVTFNWTAGCNALAYHLYVGTTFRGTDILTQWQGTNRSVLVNGLPANGATIYVTLWTQFADQGWIPVDYVYNAVSIGAGPDIAAAMNSPTPLTSLIASQATFTWTAGRNALGYHLYIGKTFRGTEILTEFQGGNQFRTVTGLPVDGSTVYVTLWTWFADTGWQPVDYTYTALTEFPIPEPTTIAVDNSGNVFLAAKQSPNVTRIGADGTIQQFAGNGTFGLSGDGGPATQAQFGSIAGLAVAPNGDLYISDIAGGSYLANGRIRYVSNGIVRTLQVSANGLNEPGNLVFDKSGQLYAIYPGSGSPPCTTVASISGGAVNVIQQIACPALGFTGPITGFAVDSKSVLYVSYLIYGSAAPDLGLEAGRIFVVGGTPLQIEANGIAIDSHNALYYTWGNAVWQVGSDTPIVGTGMMGNSGDGGPAASATFNSPTQIVFDGSDNLYIVDVGNRSIRKISNGVITTIYTAPVGSAF